MASQRVRKTRAFTLIELLVVVVIVAIVAAVVVPTVLSRARRGKDSGEQAVRITQAPPTVEAVGADGVGLPPRVERSEIRVALGGTPMLDGIRVHTRYTARFRGAFVIKSPDPRADGLSLAFPFPPGMSEARGVKLEVMGADGALAEPDDVRYDASGIRWHAAIEPGASLTVVVSYEAAGRDAFVLDVAGKGRTGEVDCEIALAPGTRAVVPSESLQPTAIAAEKLRFQVEDLVAKHAIVVELPAGSSPLGRLIALCQLAALAVLCFGAGFWYLSEAEKPGRLDTFRWGHFLLVALTYSLYFAVLGVLLDLVSAPPAIALAAAVSLPLLGVHMARVTDTRFALTRAIPLAVYTLGAATAAAFLDEHRALVILASVAGVIGYVVFTYRAFVAARKRAEEEKARTAERRAREKTVRAAQAALHKARRTLADAPEGLDLERSAVEAAIARVDRLASAESGRRAGGGGGEPASGVPPSGPRAGGAGGEPASGAAPETRTAPADEEALIGAAVGDLEAALATLASAASSAREHARREVEGLRAAVEAAEGAVDDAALGGDDEVGARRRRAEEAVASARSLLSVSAQESVARPRRAAAAASKSRAAIAEAHGALSRALESARARARSEARHCSACGATSDPGAGFCGGCGTPKPHVLACARCGAVLRVPAHLLKRRWDASPLHCESCGNTITERR